MKVLLDTCVLSEIRLPRGDDSVKSAVRAIPSNDLYLSVLSIGEIAKGISLLAPGKKKKDLASWLVALTAQFGDHILGVDVEAARIWGEVTARAQKAGVVIPGPDGLIAAIAIRHGLHVMTRNTRHFEASGVLFLNPWLNA